MTEADIPIQPKPKLETSSFPNVRFCIFFILMNLSEKCKIECAVGYAIYLHSFSYLKY
jgi:hypothetical protein